MTERNYPNRIVCMTEESVEWLYKLGLEDKIVGVSCYVERPAEAKSKTVISSFLKANMRKIKELKPDLILGFSDIQKEIARDLIAEGMNVWIANHRSLEEVLDYLLALGSMVGARAQSLEIIKDYEKKLQKFRDAANSRERKTRIYLEEWAEPYISGIRYFSDLVEACGGEDIFRNKATGVLAQDRFVDPNEVVKKDPEVILACWCGKKVDMESIKSRPGWESISAVKKNQIYELDPAIILQPGPALFEEGLDQIEEILAKANEN